MEDSNTTTVMIAKEIEMRVESTHTEFTELLMRSREEMITNDSNTGWSRLVLIPR